MIATATATATATHEDMATAVYAAMLDGRHLMQTHVLAYSHEDGAAKALRAWCIRCNADATFEFDSVTFSHNRTICAFARFGNQGE